MQKSISVFRLLFTLFISLKVGDLYMISSDKNKTIYEVYPSFIGKEKYYVFDITAAAEEYKATDFRQEVPNYPVTEFLTKNLITVLQSDDYSINHYSSPAGRPRLVKALAELYSKLINRKLDPANNIIVTVGASEALFDAIQSTTSPGDEWIIFVPHYEQYAPMLKVADGVVRYVPLKLFKYGSKISSIHWGFNKNQLQKMFNNRTRGIILNTPHNPTGKMFTKDELQFIAYLAIQWDTLVISDEVYEWVTFDSNRHERIASYPGMFERTITISSASKGYTVAGWRIGWAYGPAQLISKMKDVHVKTVFSTPSPTQDALAMAIENQIDDLDYSKNNTNAYLTGFAHSLQEKRDYIVQTLRNFGIRPIIPQSGYFILVNWSKLMNKIDLTNEISSRKAYSFVNWLIKEIGGLTIPIVNYYDDENTHLGQHYNRVCFVQTNETLAETQKKMSWQ